ncbi:MAG: Enoyl-CoA hydratase/isomerase [Frankiales bacterium]|nr:Enoyl-CoA hydratase/isomerase [Frankiales bacterium]
MTSPPLEPLVEGLLVGRDGALLELVIDRPTAKGSLNDAVVAGLIAQLERASTDQSLRAVLLRSSGADFCSGFDIVGRNAGSAERPRTGSIQRRLPTQAHRLVPLVLGLQLPVVCAVRGWAVGIGAQLAAASDHAVVADDARFWWPFVDRGFTPDSASTWLVPRLVGPVRARELLLRGRRLDGATAVEWGLVAEAAPPEQVNALARERAQELAMRATVALGLTKALLAAAPDNTLERHLEAEAMAMELSSRSPDFKEGLRAFVERRPPDFSGQ